MGRADLRMMMNLGSMTKMKSLSVNEEREVSKCSLPRRRKAVGCVLNG